MLSLANQRGMSLIELAAIIIIVGIITAVAMQSMTAQIEDVRQARTERELNILAEAIVGDPQIVQNGHRSDFGYIGDVGAFPPDLGALVSNPGGYATWNGPYIPASLDQDTAGFKTDEWGTPYVYSGGITINSTGSGGTITKKIADASSDYLLNHLDGTVLDASGSPPGITYTDSVRIQISMPNGAGTTITKQYYPNTDGTFTLDSLPVGTHPINLIYAPDNDTLHRFVTILPRHKSAVEYKFATNYFSGGSGGSSEETLRPIGSGSIDQLNSEHCSGNWSCVDDVTADGNSSYVKGSGNSWKRDSYDTQNSSVGAGTIDSVVLYMVVRGGDADMSARTSLRLSGNYYDGSQIDLTSINSYTTYQTIYTTSPATGLTWTWAEVDAIQIGVVLQDKARCTQVYAEVYYTP